MVIPRRFTSFSPGSLRQRRDLFLGREAGGLGDQPWDQAPGSMMTSARWGEAGMDTESLCLSCSEQAQ